MFFLITTDNVIQLDKDLASVLETESMKFRRMVRRKRSGRW